MNIKKNFFYNILLTVSQYFIPLIIFPHISRVFGIDKIGVVNWVDNIINYVILFNTLGLTLTGIRETTKFKNNKEELSKVFSELLIIHLCLTFITLIVYVVLVINTNQFSRYDDLFYIGIIKILSNVFLVEWLFKGIENFKFITLRTIAIKVLYVFAVLFFVTTKNDYVIYFWITCIVALLNSVINYVFALRFVKLTFKNVNIKRHLKPYFTIGLYLLMASFYNSFNTAYLGLVGTEESVGAYTTSLKIYSVILGVFSALNGVLIPRLSSLVAENEVSKFNDVVSKSITIVVTFTIPLIIYAYVNANEIIYLLAGKGYENAVICFKIIIPLLIIVGLAQIFSNQILMSLKKDNNILFASFVGAVSGLLLNLILVRNFHEIGTSITVVFSELIVTSLLFYFSMKSFPLRLPFKSIFRNLIYSVIYIPICLSIRLIETSEFISIFLTGTACLLLFIVGQLFVVKDTYILNTFSQLKRKINLSKE